MDKDVIDTLTQAGLDVSLTHCLPTIPVAMTEDGKLAPIGEEITVQSHGHTVCVRLKSVAALCTGTTRPPDFSAGPTDAYMPFFMLLEHTVVAVCARAGHDEKDAEIERVYRQLRRRPDGKDANPLHGYLQAAARLYLSIHDTSEAEYEAVLGRLARSAGRYADGASSTNYLRLIRDHVG
jgi:hypothetical protein